MKHIEVCISIEHSLGSTYKKKKPQEFEQLILMRKKGMSVCGESPCIHNISYVQMGGGGQVIEYIVHTQYTYS